MPEDFAGAAPELCPRCGYDLTGLRLHYRAVCPECAQPIDVPSLREAERSDFLRSREYTWLFLIGTPIFLGAAFVIGEWKGWRRGAEALAGAWIVASLLCWLALRRHEFYRRTRRGGAVVAANGALIAFLYITAIVCVVVCAFGGLALLRAWGP